VYRIIRARIYVVLNIFKKLSKFFLKGPIGLTGQKGTRGEIGPRGENGLMGYLISSMLLRKLSQNFLN
jgi:hypothetical protein